MGRSYADKVKSNRNRSGRKRNRGSNTEPDKPDFPIAPVVIIAIILILVGAAVFMFIGDREDSGDGSDDMVNDGPGDNNNGPAYLSIGIESTSEGIIRLEDYYGKVIVLDMFATWCAPCEAMMRELRDVDEMYPDSDVVILSVDVDERETLGMIRDFKSDNNAEWTFAMSNSRFTSNFPAESIPTMYILDREGEVVDEHVGLIDANDLADLIDPHI